MQTTAVMLEGRAVPLAIRRHRRARRISLKLSPARDAIVLTLPVRASVDSGMAFFHSKARWVLANVETDVTVELKDGAVIPLPGGDCTVRHMPGRGTTHLAADSEQLLVYGDVAFTSRRVRDFLKKYLRGICLAQAYDMAALIGKPVRDVKIRDMRSRWGSCSKDGSLSFHWQLVFAPPGILGYLIAHEVAHLAQMDHSEQFWRTVARLHPDYLAARRWLKREGHRLHRYR